MAAEAAAPSERRTVERRISDLKRERDSVRRMLEQASLKRVKREVQRQSKTIEEAQKDLSGGK
jgi:hypothetical protein